jgi:RNA polymerase sigma-70 factor, ECF subfamily
MADSALPPDDLFPQLLEQSRRFLLAIANAELSETLTAKVGASDLVQSTIAKAYTQRAQFTGLTLAELRGWLRAILLHEMTDFQRRYSTASRSVEREIPIDASVRESTPDPGPSPQQIVLSREQATRATDLLAGLNHEARLVVVLRLEYQQSFSEIATRVGKSVDATRKLFNRTLEQLRSQGASVDS